MCVLPHFNMCVRGCVRVGVLDLDLDGYVDLGHVLA